MVWLTEKNGAAKIERSEAIVGEDNLADMIAAVVAVVGGPAYSTFTPDNLG